MSEEESGGDEAECADVAEEGDGVVAESEEEEDGGDEEVGDALGKGVGTSQMKKILWCPYLVLSFSFQSATISQ